MERSTPTRIPRIGTFVRALAFTVASSGLASAASAQVGGLAEAPLKDADLPGVSFRFVEANGIRMHVAEAGEGPLVLLVHGFPESWYSWRHQITVLAGAGYRVVAPDMRGYGQTDRPSGVERYSIFEIAGDLVGLVAALEEEEAVLVGHDWGASAVMWASVLRPDVFRATVLLSVPYLQRRDAVIPPLEAAAASAEDGEVFYQVYFQDPEVTAELEADVRRSLLLFLYAASGSAPPEERWRPNFPRAEGFFSSGSLPVELPEWLREEDLRVFVRQFERSGFDGPLNWYRNIDRDWRLRGVLNRARLTQPLLYIGGELDVGVAMFRQAYDALEETAPNLTKKVLLPGIGHWTQQEAPEAVNRLILEFLREVRPSQPDPPSDVVSITEEPDHRIRFDNGRVRMFEVLLAPGGTTFFHEHLADNFVISFRSASVVSEPHGDSQTNEIETVPGQVGFTSTAEGPYSHRVVNRGDGPFHVIAMETLKPAPTPPPPPTRGSASGFSLVLESPRGRAYHLALAPGDSTEIFARPRETAVFAISAGRVRETLADGASRLWDFEPGHLRWLDRGEMLSIRNDGAAPVELVEIEVFPEPSVVGSWKLVSVDRHFEDGRVEPLMGEDPSGLLMYDAEGRMSVHLVGGNRPAFGSPDVQGGTPEELRMAFAGLISYFGTYTLDEAEGTVSHHIEGAWYPNWDGTTQTRFVALEGRRLRLSTPPILINGAEPRVVVLVWERMPSLR